MQPPNSVPDRICAVNRMDNNYFTFFNTADLNGHNFCARQQPTGVQLVSVGKGVCTCTGQNAVKRINRPTTSQCNLLIANNCANAARSVFCARVHPNGPRFRTFSSECEAQRYICTTQSVNYIEKFDRAGPCVCRAA